MYASVMDWLNYHHLLYFWMAAREGSITAASKRLRLAQPTLSAQIRSLEESLGEPLFVRTGRTISLSETGKLVYRYADEIFSLGNEMLDTLRGRPVDRPARLTVGVADVVPKLIAFRLLDPAIQLDPAPQIVCEEGKPRDLFLRLAAYELDLVITDIPVSPEMNVKAYNHLLGECGVSVFASTRLASRYRRNFPESLDGAPFLYPTANASMRRTLDQWFEAQGVQPARVAEFEDSALMKVFGQASLGLFVGPTAIEREIMRQYSVRVVGRIENLRERFYAVSVERRVKNPAVVAIVDAAKTMLFK